MKIKRIDDHIEIHLSIEEANTLNTLLLRHSINIEDTPKNRVFAGHISNMIERVHSRPLDLTDEERRLLYVTDPFEGF